MTRDRCGSLGRHRTTRAFAPPRQFNPRRTVNRTHPPAPAVSPPGDARAFANNARQSTSSHSRARQDLAPRRRHPRRRVASGAPTRIRPPTRIRFRDAYDVPGLRTPGAAARRIQPPGVVQPGGAIRRADRPRRRAHRRCARARGGSGRDGAPADRTDAAIPAAVDPRRRPRRPPLAARPHGFGRGTAGRLARRHPHSRPVSPIDPAAAGASGSDRGGGHRRVQRDRAVFRARARPAREAGRGERAHGAGAQRRLRGGARARRPSWAGRAPWSRSASRLRCRPGPS